MFVATGRRPNVGGLDALDLSISRRGIEVDERLRAAENVWAIGDVTGIALFTHVGKYQARVAAADMSGREARADYRAIPAGIFTDPEVATVGRTEGRCGNMCPSRRPGESSDSPSGSRCIRLGRSLSEGRRCGR